MFSLLAQTRQSLLSIGFPDAAAAHRTDAYWEHPEESTTPSHDGQGTGSDFFGTVWHPSFGYVNNCDGGRSHTYCDYMQQ
ncbi:hypothetical protein GUITHDRAFT_150672 [Guillardia theta CCMP2712]|uniref:Uncharacterized protein n=1 Tax=Guillardia theta (strain CCMP2712) TaxID=905079 RepID=L1JVF1_GUITC|nr:hypothetical protein GUITHDRAFT_150672 [Guillardia theta CCMP2712]EKX52078.1 hypothetical protein GUITHDRAFT_150672 [Guillardia theta CCMP2712]|eukprot:XP_005839058.1 hypothetical protein GUITHDRAFT_150672 [Guillardia theta CCMP2712]